MKLSLRAAAVATLLLVVVGVLGAVSWSSPARAATVLTGTIDVTWSKGQCQNKTFCLTLNGPVDLDLVRVHVDCKATCDQNALNLAGATGRIGKVDILTEGEDGIKISGATHDLTISGGTVSSDAHYSTAHQDCLQALSGKHVLVQNVVFACSSANNAQWYMDGLATTSKPLDIVCDTCEFHPGKMLHTVTIGLSASSGVRNSLVCPGSAKNLQFYVDPTAVTPVNTGNTKPWPQGLDPRCW
jgi:hypothetical protein